MSHAIEIVRTCLCCGSRSRKTEQLWQLVWFYLSKVVMSCQFYFLQVLFLCWKISTQEDVENKNKMNFGFSLSCPLTLTPSPFLSLKFLFRFVSYSVTKMFQPYLHAEIKYNTVLQHDIIIMSCSRLRSDKR